MGMQEGSSAPVEARRWTRDQYERMVRAGVLTPEDKVELIDGEILQVTPQSAAHAAAVMAVEEALRNAFGPGCAVRVQFPLALTDDSEPEPDVAVVPGSWRDFREAHPSTALLVVEVADASIDYDRDRKGCLYARAGIEEYWIVNLVEQRLEVYRDPGKSDAGFAYQQVLHFCAGQHISPLAKPEARINLNDILA